MSSATSVRAQQHTHASYAGPRELAAYVSLYHLTYGQT